MRKSIPIRRRVKPSEEGYVMLIAIFLMALVVISLAIAAPQVAKSIQRDRDLETYHRGMQYRRAVQLYYRTFHAYPPNADALVNTARYQKAIEEMVRKYPEQWLWTHRRYRTRPVRGTPSLYD